MIEWNIKVVIVSLVFVTLWLMFFTIHRNFHIARTRQRLFLTRSRLFNSALKGEIRFNDPAYKLVRDSLNGMIRFTHNISFFHWYAIILTNRYVHKHLLEHFNAEFSSALDKLSSKQRNMLSEMLDEAHLHILRHMMSVSLLWLVFKPVSAVISLMQKKKARAWAMKREYGWDRFDAEAAYCTYEDNNSSTGLLKVA